MSYTREQAEEVLKDFNTYPNSRHYEELSPENIDFLNHKFGVKYTVGKWYKKDYQNAKVCYQGNEKGFGTWSGEWGCNWKIWTETWQPMTNEEVIDFLRDEAKKRYNIGDIVKSLWSGKNYEILRFGCSIDNEHFHISGISVLDLKTGEWAKVVKKKDPVKEQIDKLEKELETLKNKYNEQKQ